MTAPPEPPHRSRRRWFLRGLALALVLAGAGGAWWHFRGRAPAHDPPTVDLSRADPEVARAINESLDAVRAKPRDAAAWGKLGMLLRAHDYDTECATAFRVAAELDPNDYRWPYLEGLTRVLFEPGPGLERLRRAAELAPATRPEPRLRTGEILLERGDLDGAAGLAEGVLKADPASARAELLLARVAAARGDWPEALRHAAACDKDPAGRRAVALLRGEAFAARGERETADAEFRRAAELPELRWPDPLVAEVERMRVGADARIALARQMIDEGQVADAAELLAAEARRAPDDPKVALALGQVLIRAQDAPAARTVLEGFVARHPTSVDGWFHLGVALGVLGEFEKAAGAFRTVIKLKPDHALAHFNLGHCHRKLGDKPAAKAAYEEALRCRPDHQPSRQALAELDSGK